MIKVGMVSLGCPKNQMDAELMLAKLEAAGFTLTAESGLADVVIVNTCGFIEDAKREAIENILEFAQLKKEGQIKKLIVTGCLSQRYQQELCNELPECDAVLGLGANVDIVEAVRAVLNGETVASFPPLSRWELDGERVQTTPHFFAYLRIADGCDNRCAYCAIPSIRGGLRSRSMDAVVQEARTLAQNGVKELVVIAQDTTVYGVDRSKKSELPQLLDRLCEIDGIQWIRLMYCYSEHITDELLDVMAKQDKIVKYMDLPIQHASGNVLRAMNRVGNKERLTAQINNVRQKVPGIVLRTTVMTGFPGETEEDFEELCAFIKEMKFERLGCFAFSCEEGTAAAEMANQIDEEVKAHRRDVVMELQSRIAAAYQEEQIGTVKQVLVESFDKYAECWFGRTAADAPDIDGKVFFTAKGRIAPGDIINVRITEAMDWDLVGEQV